MATPAVKVGPTLSIAVERPHDITSVVPGFSAIFLLVFLQVFCQVHGDSDERSTIPFRLMILVAVF